MKILLNNSDLNEALNDISDLGFIPTMGSLHKGHVSLIKKSLKECKKTIVSIFVNPTQFNNKKDYENYPKNNKKDLSILKKLGVNFVFLPNKKQIYNSKKNSKININKKDKVLCAKYRRGHFEGVIDVMTRLIKIIRPDKIFMGEKDFQQLYLIKKYVNLKSKFEIISCKTIRDKNKVALSSRNLLLRKIELVKAGKITNELILFKKKLTNKRNIKKLFNIKKNKLANIYNINIEYLELRNTINLKLTNKIKNSKIFIAYYLNDVRMIDNY